MFFGSWCKLRGVVRCSTWPVRWSVCGTRQLCRAPLSYLSSSPVRVPFYLFRIRRNVICFVLASAFIKFPARDYFLYSLCCRRRFSYLFCCRWCLFPFHLLAKVPPPFVSPNRSCRPRRCFFIVLPQVLMFFSLLLRQYALPAVMLALVVWI